MQIHRLIFLFSTLLLLCTVFIPPQTARAQDSQTGQTSQTAQAEQADQPAGQKAAAGELTPVQLRALFLPDFLQDFADTNAPLPTSPGSSVPSAECVQNCFDSLQLEIGDRAYIIGQGTGFLAAFFARNGIDVTVSESDAELLIEYRLLWKELGLSGIRPIDLDELGANAQNRRFEAILIHAAVQTIPESIIGLLTENGTLLAPITSPQDTQVLIKIAKNGGSWSITTLDEQFFPSEILDLSQE